MLAHTYTCSKNVKATFAFPRLLGSSLLHAFLFPPSAGRGGSGSSPTTTATGWGVDINCALLHRPTVLRRAQHLTGVDRGSREEHFPEGETYLLPLAACEGEDKEAAVTGGYRLPLSCEVLQALFLLPMHRGCLPPDSPHRCERSAGE